MDAARALYRKDSEWAAPFLWRSEFNNIMALAMRKGLVRLDEAKAMQGEIADLLAGREYFVPAGLVLELAEKSGCTAYDCEFALLPCALM